MTEPKLLRDKERLKNIFMNRRQYEQYVCKRIPGKQAVVVMACDNTHISDDMYVY